MASVTTFYSLAPTSAGTAIDPPFHYPPTFKGGWDVTFSQSNSANIALIAYQASNEAASRQVSEVLSTPVKICVLREVCPDRLAAQTISGTVTITVGAVEGNVAANAVLKYYIWVRAGQTGDTVRGVLLDYEGVDELPTTAQGVTFTAALSAVDAQAGDTLVIEKGVFLNNSTGSSQNATLYCGNAYQGVALTPGSLNVSTEIGTTVFSNPILMQFDTPGAGDVLQGNEQILVMDGTTGEIIRIVIPSILTGTDTLADPGSGAHLSDGTLILPLVFSANLVVMAADLSVETVFDAIGIRPMSVAVDRDDHFYVGYRGNSTNTPSQWAIRKFDRTGTLLGTFLATRELSTPTARAGGTSGLDLLPDQRTIVYVGGGREIRRYDVEADSQLSNLVTLPAESGSGLRGIKVLPDGGYLVADTINIKRLNSLGAITQTYEIAGQDDWLAVALSPDALSFVASNSADSAASVPMYAKFDLQTGSVLAQWTGDSVPDTVSNQGTTVIDGFQASTGFPPVYPDFEVADEPIRWLRRSSVTCSENRRLSINLLELLMDQGVGQPSGADENTQPQVMLRYSIDGGRTWSAELWRPMGHVGQWLARMQWWRLGQGRKWVFELSGTAAVPTHLIDAFIDADPSDDPPKS